MVTPLVSSDEGLTRIMGQIADHDTDRGSTFVHRVVCLVAEVASSDAARPDAQIQWPTAVVIDGVRYPEDE